MCLVLGLRHVGRLIGVSLWGVFLAFGCLCGAEKRANRVVLSGSIAIIY